MAISPHTRRITEARRVANAAIQGATAARAGEQAATGGDAVREAPRESVGKVRATWIGFRAARKFEKGKVAMEYTKPISTPMVQSKTTRDVATGAAVAGGTAYGVVAAARALLGDANIPWDPSADEIGRAHV